MQEEWTVLEMIERLKNDDSWEPDPQVREAVCMGLFMNLTMFI